jgi:hypothetical protein
MEGDWQNGHVVGPDRTFSGRHFHKGKLAVALLVALRSTVAVALACLAVRSSAYISASGNLGW